MTVLFSLLTDLGEQGEILPGEEVEWNKIFPFLLIYLVMEKCMCWWKPSLLILQPDVLVYHVGRRVYWDKHWKRAQTGLGSSPPLSLCWLCDLRHIMKVLWNLVFPIVTWGGVSLPCRIPMRTELPDLANSNIKLLVKSECQINNNFFFLV